MIEIPAALTMICIASEFGPVIRSRCPANDKKTPAQKAASHSSPQMRTGCRTFQPNQRALFGTTRVNRKAKARSEEHTSELQSQSNLVCRLLLEKKKTQQSR